MKILLVEDNPDDLFFARHELERLGHRVVAAGSGDEALALFRSDPPDLVVTDIHLPGMDGFELTRMVQRLAAPRWQPVLFLTSHRDDALQAKALSYGADAYVVKPVAAEILAAKLAVIDRLIATQRQAEERARELERFYTADAEDRRIAQHLLQRLVSTDKLEDPAVEHWISPAALFSGDLIAAARTPGGVLHVMLADGTGHGLAASINVLPIVAPFYRMTEKGFSVDTIVRELNMKVRELLPADRFVAATLVAVDFREGYVRLWNGGNPDPWMIDRVGNRVHSFSTHHVPLGVLDDDEFEANSEAHALTSGSHLVLYSDGLIELENADGEMFGGHRLAEALLGCAAADRLEGVVRAVNRHADGQGARDDVSLLLIDCNPEPGLAEMPRHASAHPAAAPGNWRFAIRLAGSELRKLDVVPILLGLANHFDGARERSGELFVILAELFNNALDHGLLRLDSGRKLSPDGMESWMEERSRRLEALQDGEISLEIEQLVYEDKGWLRITCRDSGPGFDHASRSDVALENSELPFGRGLALVHSLAGRLEYNEAGNEVRATLALPTLALADRSC